MVKPLAPVGKHVRCAVAPKTFVRVETLHFTLCLYYTKETRDMCERTSHTSAHGGGGALSDDNLA